MYSSVRDLTRSRLGATSISPVAAAVRINGLEWHSASLTYHQELVKIYYKHDYLTRGKTFAQALDEGPLRAALADVGLLRKFEINVTIVKEEVFLGKGARPWRAAVEGKKRIRVAVDPEWHEWHDTLLAKIAKHAGESAADVEFYDQTATRKKLSSDKAELAKELLYARGTGVYAVLIKKTSTSKKTSFGIMSQLGEAVKRELPAYKPRQRKPAFPDPVAAPIGNEVGSLAVAKRSAAGRKVAPVSAKPPTKPLTPIASRLTERISAELTKLTGQEAAKSGGKESVRDSYKSVKRVMKEPTALVHAAVHTAVTDDKLYTGADGGGAKSAADYWRKRKVNIGDLINKISRNVAEQVGELNAEGMFVTPKTGGARGSVSIGDAIAGTSASLRAQQKPEFSHDIARKAFTAATINAGIWDSFLDMVGYNGTYDDGGNDLGPCASFSDCSKVHGSNGLAHACLPDVPLCPPRVHIVPRHTGHVVPHHRHHRWAHGGHHNHHHHDDVVFQSVVVDLTEKHKNPRKRHGKRGGGSAAASKVTSVTSSSGVVHLHDGEDSSSDEEEHTMSRAIRRKSGKPFRSMSSPDDSDGSEDDSVSVVAPGAFLVGGGAGVAAVESKTAVSVSTVSMNEANYSNFLTVLKRSGRKFDKPCVVMCLPNSVLTGKNMEVFERHGGDAACAVFAEHYICHTRGPVRAFADLIDKTVNKIVLVSSTAVCWAIHAPAHTLAIADRFAHEIAHPRRCVKPVLMHCRGYPDYVHFVHVDVLHKYLPRNV